MIRARRLYGHGRIDILTGRWIVERTKPPTRFELLEAEVARLRRLVKKLTWHMKMARISGTDAEP